MFKASYYDYNPPLNTEPQQRETTINVPSRHTLARLSLRSWRLFPPLASTPFPSSFFPRFPFCSLLSLIYLSLFPPQSLLLSSLTLHFYSACLPLPSLLSSAYPCLASSPLPIPMPIGRVIRRTNCMRVSKDLQTRIFSLYIQTKLDCQYFFLIFLGKNVK